MNKENILENYFRLLTLTFWPIIWYKWVFISSKDLERVLFFSYASIALIYVIYFSYTYIKSSDSIKPSLMFAYRLSSIATFIITILSFVLFPKSIFLLYAKIIVLFIYLYFSYKEVYRRKNEEGVVGIMSFLLLLIFTIFY
ncbi:hypothetical protein EXD82_08190 [Peptacetobacter hominis]|uniref:Uncharacterized protein n=1 Tax=Peptacetobacter hominis TaxID=2743610 RepID=A0A544QU27_9FIRM|nr:hypothetical protein EXD82_08190 [Peptacetobacter hominis]